MSNHLHILHLPFTGIKKIDNVAETRLNNLFIELEKQGIKDYSIIEGFYDAKNTKQAIHKGHRKIVQLSKEQGMPSVCIAEDDIVFTHHNSYNYFISQMPKSYDIFSGLVYSATIEGNRIMNGGSGMTSLYVVHNRFYDFFLSMNIDNHVDRELALTAYNHEYYVCQSYVVTQRGGYSFNKNQSLFYEVYLEGKELYKGEDSIP
jgi:hypothetical protein